MREVSLSELERMEEGSFVLIDTRSTDNVRYGMIPGAIHIPETELMENAARYASSGAFVRSLCLKRLPIAAENASAWQEDISPG